MPGTTQPTVPIDTFPKDYFAADLIHLLIDQKEPPGKDDLEATLIVKKQRTALESAWIQQSGRDYDHTFVLQIEKGPKQLVRPCSLFQYTLRVTQTDKFGVQS